MNSSLLLFRICIVSGIIAPLVIIVDCFSIEAATLSRSRLREALLSPAGKLTFSPEIIIPEPANPTALLLQSTQIAKLSESMRSDAKANAVFLSCSISSLKQFASEQGEARGNFPGPVPVIYCNEKNEESINEIAEAGASGVLVPVLSSSSDDDDAPSSPPLQSVNALKSCKDEMNSNFLSVYKTCLEHGLQGIPEIVLDGTVSWSEEDIVEMVDFIKESCGDDGPVALVLTMENNVIEQEGTEDDEQSEKESIQVMLPPIPSSLKKQIILGSVRVKAGKNRMGIYTSSLKESGFAGAFLRAECAPAQGLIDAELSSQFWRACISGLKSVRSKTFGFRAEINVMVNRDVPMEWYNLQKSVMESGALGETQSMDDVLDADAGDFMGF